MTFFYLTNFSYVKTVLTIWSVSQFAIFKNRHVFADPITYVNIDHRMHQSYLIIITIEVFMIELLVTFHTVPWLFVL